MVIIIILFQLVLSVDAGKTLKPRGMQWDPISTGLSDVDWYGTTPELM